MFSVCEGRGIFYRIELKKGVKKMTEETTKPAAQKIEEPKSKPAAKNQEKTNAKASPKKPEKTIEKSTKKPGVVFIGNKPPMSYVMAVITAFSSNSTNEITLKARGRSISTAVDTAEITRRRFLKDLAVIAIDIGTEEMPPREGEDRARMVSTIEIKLAKK
jgi:DNA-binding protein